MNATATKIQTRLLRGFDDPSFGAEEWTRLLPLGDTDAICMTREVQRTWWETLGHGRLLLIVAERDGRTVALAPLFTSGGMIFNLCPEDYLDFVGDIGDPEILDALLNEARAQVPDFCGFQFYFIGDQSRTGQRLRDAAARLGLTCFDEGALPAPALGIAGQPDAALAATRKKSLVRHERHFQKTGTLEVQHFQDGEKILPQLAEFFAQHVARRATTEQSSIFLKPEQRAFYEHLTQRIAHTGWLRFTRVSWNGKSIAFHFGLCYHGRYLYAIPTFDIELSRHWPGEVLMRQLLLAAMAEGAKVFDFGIGDEAYKYRYATDVNHLRTWGLYPPKCVAKKSEESVP